MLSLETINDLVYLYPFDFGLYDFGLYDFTTKQKKSPPKLEGSILNYVINLFFMQQHRFDGWTLGYDQHVVAHLVICSDVDGVDKRYWHGLFFDQSTL